MERGALSCFHSSANQSLKKLLLILVTVGCFSCHSTSLPKKPQLVVAAAANLTEAFNELEPLFEQSSGADVVFSYGATGDLARQIENGAPFDVFAAADIAHVERLEKQGLFVDGTKAIYARGKLVAWVPSGKNKLTRVEDVAGDEFERIAIAKPDVAPYGQAAIESLKALGLWERIQSRVVYGQSVSQTKQFAATGNAEVAFIPLALVKAGEGSFVEISESLHTPLNQAAAVLKSSANERLARRFLELLLAPEGQKVMQGKGYSLP